jgi:hypothetical protein
MKSAGRRQQHSKAKWAQANLGAADAVSCVLLLLLLLLRRLRAALVALFQPQEAPVEATQRRFSNDNRWTVRPCQREHECYARPQTERDPHQTQFSSEVAKQAQQQPTSHQATEEDVKQRCTHAAQLPTLLLPLVVSVPVPVPVVPVSWYSGRCCSGCQEQHNRVWISAANAHDNSRRDTQNAATAPQS